MGTVPGRFRGRAPPLLGTVPERFRGRASPLLTQSTRTEARSRRTTAAKRNKSRFFRTYKCLQRAGVTTLAHWALLNESKWTWGKGWSLMWSSQRLKTLSCIQANPEALTFVLFQASSAERILIERGSIFERWELDEQCRFWFACDKLINKILPWNCCRHIADDWWFVVILDAWHAFKDDMNPVVGSSSVQNKMETT